MYDWHLNSNCLIFSNGGDQASIRTFRAGTAAGLQITAGDEPIQLGEDTQRSSQDTPYLQLTNDGNVVVVFRSYTSETEFTDSVSLITAQRGEQWHLPLEGSICKPAIGKAAVYFIEAQQNRQDCSDHGPAFKKISLLDGSLLYATFPPEIEEAGVFVRQDQEQKPSGAFSKVESPTHGRKIEVSKFDTSLKLAGNEIVAVWSDLHLRVYVFSAATGQILFTYNRSTCSILRVSTITPQVWDFYLSNVRGVDFMRLTSYNERTEGLHYAFGNGDFRRAASSAEVSFIDADYPIGFDLCHSMTIVDEHTRDPFTTVAISGIEKKFSLLEGQSFARLEPVQRSSNDRATSDEEILVTLPPKKGQKERRLLELETPWVIRDEDFFGLVQGYLVYHNFTDQELIVIDFWPEW